MRLHIDTDVGVDDGLALVIASRLPKVTIEAVSAVFGNVSLGTALRNAFLFRSLLNASWPIFQGRGCPLTGEALNAASVHGEDGLGGATHDPDFAALADIARRSVAADLLMVRQQVGAKIIILGLGPATNIPNLISLYGRENVIGVVLMSGVFFDVGNISPTAEFNAACDPQALREVVNSGLPVTFVPLDICRKVQLERRTVKGYETADPSPAAQFVVRSHMAYMDRYRRWEAIDGCFPHDSIALFAAVYPDRFFKLRGRVAVAEDGTTRLTGDPEGQVQVVTGGDLAWLRRRLQRIDVNSFQSEPDQRSGAGRSPTAIDESAES